ncbi:ARM repeat-containing protein [Ceratobasidium sp. AG-I]|nr:ARM repeat-containing protein [Ceratobasidium sp. AG-I]
MDETIPDEIQRSSFGHEEEFMTFLKNFLEENTKFTPVVAVGNESSPHLSRLSAILDEYQEQPYLLDPYLSKMVEPVVEELKKEIRTIINQDDIPPDRVTRLHQLAILMYWYSKTRGTKSIVSFFPHTVQDLPLALEFTEKKAEMLSETEAWALRYVMTLWLSLICMIPFDLARFDEPGASPDRLVAARLDSIGKIYIRYPGIERESAAMLLARLYMRTDMLHLVPRHLDWSIQRIRDGANTFEVIGLTQVVAVMMKAGGAGLALPYANEFRNLIEELRSSNTNKDLLTQDLMKDTVIRKYRIKLIVRLAMCELPGKPRKVNLQNRILVVKGTGEDNNNLTDDYDIPIPESIENVIEELISGVQDQDTAVRYSSAKGIARVASRLPEAFSDEILDAVTALFSIHGVQLADGTLDLPPTSEATWHGACLAYAELARRGLISQSRLGEVIGWICKALAFDVRKGAHSVGSSVRDSSAYVLWALVRAQSVEVLAPHLLEIALRLTTMSLFDREVHVRRAASAAYQEAVGRTGSIPHGIDVLRVTDFYAVSIRRNAFLVAAPQVAEFLEYQKPLIDHVMQVTIRHWDPNIRVLGSQALSRICAVDLKRLGSETAVRLSARLRSMDTNDVHGALLSIAEIARAFKEAGLEEERLQCFKYLAILPSSAYQKFRGDLIVEGACLLVAESVSTTALSLPSVAGLPDWRHIVIQNGMKHPNEAVQTAATSALANVSELVDCAQEVQTFAREFQAKNASRALQCSISRAFGALAYDKFGNGLDDAIRCLVGGITTNTETYSKRVEARRNCITSLAEMVVRLMKTSPDLLSSSMNRIYTTILSGFDDYTADQRGDVGSWVRMAALRAVASISEALFLRKNDLVSFENYLPPDAWHSAVAGVLKQGVERLDNVRAVAGEQLMALIWSEPVRKGAVGQWAIPGLEKLGTSFPQDQIVSWSDGEWLFPRMPALLDIKAYRSKLLSGIIISFGSRNESSQLPLVNGLCAYANSLPISSEPNNFDSRWGLIELVDAVLDTGRSNLSVNSVMIPVLKTVDVLFEGEVLTRLCYEETGVKRLRIALDQAGKGADRLKSVPRITGAMKIVVDFIALPPVAQAACEYLDLFLGHRFPRVSADTAEALYLLTQTQDIEESEQLDELLLETSWINLDDTTRSVKAKEVSSLLSTLIRGV